MSKIASNRRHKQGATRLVFEAVAPGALIAPVRSHFGKTPKGRLLLSGGKAGDRYFLACRFANELGAPLTEINVSKYIGETEKNLRQLVSKARAQSAILLFDEAEALFTKRGTAPSRRTRAGRNAGYLLQVARRYSAPVLLSTTTSGPLLDALEKLAGLVVEFGRRPDEVQHAVRGKPVTGQNFRIFVGGDELGICHVDALALGSDVEPFDRPVGEASVVSSVTLRRAVTASSELFAWYEARRGKNGQRDVRIELLDGPAGKPVVSWLLRKARPLRWIGPALDGLENTVAMEELEIAFEQLEWH